MAYIIGLTLALGTTLFARITGFDRDRAFYPTVVVVVGSYYVLFAAQAGSAPAALLESLVTAVFVALAVTGFRSSPWVVVAALAGHGLFDAAHGMLIANPGVPVWWPAFCGTYDVAAAAGLALVIVRPAIASSQS
jgi:hypothetical protein